MTVAIFYLPYAAQTLHLTFEFIIIEDLFMTMGQLQQKILSIESPEKVCRKI